MGKLARINAAKRAAGKPQTAEQKEYWATKNNTRTFNAMRRHKLAEQMEKWGPEESAPLPSITDKLDMSFSYMRKTK